MDEVTGLLSSTKIWTLLASAMAVHAFFERFLYSISPLLNVISTFLHRLFGRPYPYFFDIPEYEGTTINALYSDVHLYLSTLTPLSTTTTRLTLTRSEKPSLPTSAPWGRDRLAGTSNKPPTLITALSDYDRLDDTFNGVVVSWKHISAVNEQQQQQHEQRIKTTQSNDLRSNTYTLCINKEEKHLILPDYFDHIKDRAAEIRLHDRQRLLYTNDGDHDIYGRKKMWSSVPLKHPSTFDTLAMEPSQKADIMADLREFAEDGGEFYQRTGRAWKRGYLLYGPPGTGKSSMIAAMANYMRYDIYGLELTKVKSNSELLDLLLQTTSKSIIVIEDIDCSVDLTKREKKPAPPPPPKDYYEQKPTITLSGLLNFTDGLWSSCGSEKIFVFTTNHIENIDPALLRPGRMDMHVEMGYCSFPAIKILMRNYWGVEDVDGCDMLMEEMEGVIKEAEISPADVSEVLTRNRRKDKKRALEELLEVLKKRVDLKRKRGEELPEVTTEVTTEPAEMTIKREEELLEVCEEKGELKNKIGEEGQPGTEVVEVLKEHAGLQNKTGA